MTWIDVVLVSSLFLTSNIFSHLFPVCLVDFEQINVCWVLRFDPISGQIINKFQFLRPQKFGKMLVTGIWPWAREYETDGFKMVGCCFFAFMKSIFSIFFSSDSYNLFVTYFFVLVARRLDLNLQERLEIIVFIDLFHLSSNNISLALQWWWSILIDAAA